MSILNHRELAVVCASHQPLSAPKVGSGLTGLYSTIANPVLARLGYQMANMRLIPCDGGREGRQFRRSNAAPVSRFAGRSAEPNGGWRPTSVRVGLDTTLQVAL
jgi:hypothetical protein